MPFTLSDPRLDAGFLEEARAAGSPISKVTARSVACARASTTPCRWKASGPWLLSCGSLSAATAEACLPHAMTYRILTLNQISPRGLQRFQGGPYQIGPEIERPHAILLRSADLHSFDMGPEVRAVGRAGAGVNNIPVDELSRRGIPVFNTPGANANAVKELVLAGLLLAARNLNAAWLFARDLSGDDAAIDEAAEKGKTAFVGFELPGRTLGVVGLGAIGVEVANAALALGMKVLGYDPADHGAARVAAVSECRAGALARRSLCPRGCGHGACALER